MMSVHEAKELRRLIRTMNVQVHAKAAGDIMEHEIDRAYQLADQVVADALRAEEAADRDW